MRSGVCQGSETALRAVPSCEANWQGICWAVLGSNTGPGRVSVPGGQVQDSGRATHGQAVLLEFEVLVPFVLEGLGRGHCRLVYSYTICLHHGIRLVGHGSLRAGLFLMTHRGSLGLDAAAICVPRLKGEQGETFR